LSDGVCSTGEIEDGEDKEDREDGEGGEDGEGMEDILASYSTSPHPTQTIGFLFFTGGLHRQHRLCAGACAMALGVSRAPLLAPLFSKRGPRLLFWLLFSANVVPVEKLGVKIEVLHGTVEDPKHRVKLVDFVVALGNITEGGSTTFGIGATTLFEAQIKKHQREHCRWRLLRLSQEQRSTTCPSEFSSPSRWLSGCQRVVPCS
jgi:hypothetical protein